MIPVPGADMLPKLLTLLAVLPLFLPTGICVCHDHGAQDLAPPEASLPHQPSTPDHDEDEHVPGCPSVRKLGGDGLAKTSAPEAVASTTLYCLPLPAAADACPFPLPELVPFSFCDFPARPLFLTLRALRI